MYITGSRAHFCHLPGLGQVGHSPSTTSGSAGTLDWAPIWLGSWSTCHQISDQPNAWQVDILSHGWLAGQLQLASWLAGWLPVTKNVNMTLPTTTYLTNPKLDRSISCHMAGWLANCSWQTGWLADCLLHKMSTWPWYMLCPYVWLCSSQRPVVRCTPHKMEASSGQEQYYVRSAWHVVSLWVRLTFSQTYPQ